MTNDQELRAYGVGYYHGRTHGVEDCPYEDDNLRHYYTRGYEAGVTDYCELDLQEDPDWLPEGIEL